MKAICNAVLLVCGAALLALPPVASGAAGKTHEFKIGTIELEGSNDYDLEVTALQEDKKPAGVAISAKKESLSANYEVQTERLPGIHAAFGSLGRLDVSFERRKKAVLHPEPHCPWVLEKGAFRGSFSFVGEGGYTAVEAVDPQGTMFRLPHGFCGFNDDRRALPFLGLDQRVLAVENSEQGRIVSFNASQEAFVDRPSFYASLSEKVEGMDIERSARTHGKRGSFTSAGTARGSVHPPAPFAGSALFSHPAGKPPAWTGSLMVSFPGAPEVPLAGEWFTAKLCPRISVLSSCLKRR
jgi:hypothetical protein